MSHDFLPLVFPSNRFSQFHTEAYCTPGSLQTVYFNSPMPPTPGRFSFSSNKSPRMRKESSYGTSCKSYGNVPLKDHSVAKSVESRVTPSALHCSFKKWYKGPFSGKMSGVWCHSLSALHSSLKSDLQGHSVAKLVGYGVTPSPLQSSWKKWFKGPFSGQITRG